MAESKELPNAKPQKDMHPLKDICTSLARLGIMSGVLRDITPNQLNYIHTLSPILPSSNMQ
jgi:hypothetical protein